MKNELQQINSPLAIIEKAIELKADPGALEKLMELQERHEGNNARKAYNVAIVAAQAEMPTVFKERKGGHGEYASYDDIMRILRPVLTRHSLAVSFNQSEKDGQVTVTCRIMHGEGHSEETSFTLPTGTARGGNEAQAQGSANSYAKRYCLCNALNIATGDRDDDAKALDHTPKVSPDQAKTLKQLCGVAGTDVEKFLEHYKAEDFEDINAGHYTKAKSLLNSRIEQNGGAE